MMEATSTSSALDLGTPEDSPEQKAIFQAAVAEHGFIPNILKAYAFDLSKLQGFLSHYRSNVADETSLSPLHREMIAVVVSGINRCQYCVTAHGRTLRALSNDPELTAALALNHRSAKLEPSVRAMLDFAAKLTETPSLVGDEDRAELRGHGFTDRSIWHIASVAAHYNMSNRVALAAGVRLNEEYWST